MDRTLSLRARIIICALLLLIGAAALWLIFSTEPVAERETRVRQTAMRVETTHPEAGPFRPVIEATGTVRPASEITLMSRVSGEVVGIAESFEPGGYAQQGEVLLRIDDADYQNVLLQRESALQQAIAELELERGQQAKALMDFQQLGKSVPDDRRALILREPQLRSAEAAIQSARAALEQARLDLQRTTVRAPFDAHILSRDVDVGSLVSAGDPLARLAGIEVYWVEATIPLDKLRWLSFPEDTGDEGSPVRIRHRTAWDKGLERRGNLKRMIGELEGNTRLARVLVAVEDPLARKPESAGFPPLMIGTFVACLIEGREIADVVRLRREHVRSQDTIWLMRDGALTIQPVDVVFQDAEYAYVREGLTTGDQVITTTLSTVQEGARLRLEAEGPE